MQMKPIKERVYSFRSKLACVFEGHDFEVDCVAFPVQQQIGCSVWKNRFGVGRRWPIEKTDEKYAAKEIAGALIDKWLRVYAARRQ